MLLSVELHLPQSRSLKEKRAVLQPVLVGARQRFGVSAAEVDHQELHQRASLAMAAVGSSPAHLEEVLDSLERWVWSRGDLEVTRCERSWIDPEI